MSRSQHGIDHAALPLDRITRPVVDYYESKLAQFGPTAKGMDWNGEASQALRFSVLCGICDLDGMSVHDVGAGAGHLLTYFKDKGLNVEYSGSDLSESMVKAALERHPEARINKRDILTAKGAERYDVVMCSGLFHVKLRAAEKDWQVFVRSMTRRMYEMCRIGIAFNLMSDRIDYREKALYYSNPGEMLDFCRMELSPHVLLRHDYPLHEYTAYVYRNPPER